LALGCRLRLRGARRSGCADGWTFSSCWKRLLQLLHLPTRLLFSFEPTPPPSPPSALLSMHRGLPETPVVARVAFRSDGLPPDKLSQETALFNSVLDAIRLSKGATALAEQAPPRAFVCAPQS
jgi:hypothetical protein